MNSQTTRLLILGLVLLTLVKGLWWSAAIPAYGGPDEVAHLDYLRHFLIDGRYPVYGVTRFFDYGTPVPDLVRSYTTRFNGISPEAFQPPLTYLLVSLFVPNGATLSPESLLTFARTISVLLSLGIVLLAYATARMLVPEDSLYPIAAAGLVSLQPSLSYITSTFNNDALAVLLGTAMVFWLVRVLIRGQLRMIDAVVLGGLFGLGLLTKQHLLLFLFPIALVIFWTRRSFVAFLGRLALTLGSTALVSGWWYARSLDIYGDWLGLFTLRGSALYSAQPFAGIAHPLFLVFWPGFWMATIRSLFAFFGWDRNIGISYGVNLQDGPLGGMVLLGFLGLGVTLWVLVRSGLRRDRSLDEPYGRFLILSFITLSLFVVGILAYSYAWDVQPGGRWLLPIVLPMTVLVLAGLWRIVAPNRRLILTVSLLTLLFGFHQLALNFLVREYVIP